MTSRLDDEALAGQPLAQGGVGGDEAGAQRLLGRLAKVPLAGRPFRAENGCVAVRVTSLFLWSVEAVV